MVEVQIKELLTSEFQTEEQLLTNQLDTVVADKEQTTAEKRSRRKYRCNSYQGTMEQPELMYKIFNVVSTVIEALRTVSI